MKILVILLVVALSSLISQPCTAYGEPFVIGKGRYFTAEEKKEFLRILEMSRQTTEKEKYEREYEKYATLAGKPRKIDLIQFTKFEPIFNAEYYKGARAAYETFMICFGCKEGIPEKQRVAREKQKIGFYDIWVISGNFIILERHPSSGNWRVLGSGGAE